MANFQHGSKVFQMFIQTTDIGQGSLFDLMNDIVKFKIQLTQQEIVVIFAKIAFGVAELHFKSIPHRNITPHNFIVFNPKKVKWFQKREKEYPYEHSSSPLKPGVNESQSQQQMKFSIEKEQFYQKLKKVIIKTTNYELFVKEPIHKFQNFSIQGNSFRWQAPQFVLKKVETEKKIQGIKILSQPRQKNYQGDSNILSVTQLTGSLTQISQKFRAPLTQDEESIVSGIARPPNLFKADSFSLGLVFLHFLNGINFINNEEKDLIQLENQFLDKLQNSIMSQQKIKQIFYEIQEKWHERLSNNFFKVIEAMIDEEDKRVDVITALSFFKNYYRYGYNQKATKEYLKEEKKLAKCVEYIASVRPKEQKIIIYKAEQGFSTLSKEQLDDRGITNLQKRMGIISLEIGEIHFMGGTHPENFSTSNVHFAIRNFDIMRQKKDYNRPNLDSSAKVHVITEQEDQYKQQDKEQDKEQFNVQEEVQQPLEESKSFQQKWRMTQIFEQGKFQTQNSFKEPFDQINELDDANQLNRKISTSEQSREKSLQQQQQQNLLLENQKKQKYIPTWQLDFELDNNFQPLPDGGFSDSILLADDYFIYTVGGDYKAYGRGYCRRFSYIDKQWKGGNILQQGQQNSMIDVEQISQIKRLLQPQSDGISACIVGKQWIYAFGGICFETQLNRVSQTQSGGYQYSFNAIHSNMIQRINLKDWGLVGCKWEQVACSTKRALPKISRCAAVHIPDTDKVILFGGDYQLQESYKSLGYEYIYVDLKLGYGKNDEERVIEKINNAENNKQEQKKEKKVECQHGKEKFRLVSALSVGYMSGPKVYAMFQGNNLALDETVLNVCDKFQWNNKKTNWKRISVDEEKFF